MSNTTQQADRNNSNAGAGGKATLTPTAIEDVHSAQQLELNLSMPAPAGNQATRPGSASAIESFVTADGTDTGDTPAGAAQATSADIDTNADAADATTTSSAKPLTASNEQPPQVTIDDATDDEANETKGAHLATPTGRRSEAQPHALQDAKSKRKTQSDQDGAMAGHVKDDNSYRKKDVKASHAVPSVTEIFGSIRRSITAPSTSKRASVADAALPKSANEAKRAPLPAAPIEPKLEADAAKSAPNNDAKKKRRESLMLLTRKIGEALNSPTGKDADNLALDAKIKGQQGARASKSSAQHRETPKPKLADEAAASQTLASAQMASLPEQVSKQPIVTSTPLEPTSQLPPLPGPDLGIQPTDPIVAPGEPQGSTSNTLPPLPGPFLGPPPALIAAEAKAKALYGQLKRRMSVVFGASPTEHHPAAASTVGPQPDARGAKEDAQSAGSALLTSADAGKAIILNADGSSQVVQATTKAEGNSKIKQAPSAGSRAETSDAAHAQKDEKSSSSKKSRRATLSDSFRRLASHQMATPEASDALSKSVSKHSGGKEVDEQATKNADAHAPRAQSDHVTAGNKMQSDVLKDKQAIASAPLSTGQESEGQDNMLATFSKLLHRPLPHTPKANARGEADAESANDAVKPASLNARGASQRGSKEKSNKSTLAGSVSVLGAFRSKLGQYRAPTGLAGWSHSPKTAAPATAYANVKGAQGKVATAEGQEAAKHASKKDGQNAKEDADVKDAHNVTSSSNAGNAGASAAEARPYGLGDDSAPLTGQQVKADVQESDAIEPQAVAGGTAAQAVREIKA